MQHGNQETPWIYIQVNNINSQHKMKKAIPFLLLSAALMTTTMFVSCSDDDDDNSVVEEIDTLSGNYTGRDTLTFSVKGMNLNQPNTEDVSYAVKANKDGSIDVTLPSETFDFTAVKMGNIVQGSYTVSHIPYDSNKGVWYLDYAAQKDSAMVSIFGKTKKYEVKEGKITVSFRNDSVFVKNEHMFDGMPMALNGSFGGKK